MITASASAFISDPLPQAVATHAATESPVTRDSRQQWQRLINYRLIEWRYNPSLLDEEGTVTPSKDTIQFAIDLATQMSETGMAAPTRIVPDVNGGIVFERKGKDHFESLRISAHGSVEHRVFENCRLVYREPWTVRFRDTR
jgi:hypothetical protein